MSNDGDDGREATGGSDHEQRLPDTGGADETVPRVELALQDLSVAVTGQSDDDLERIEESALGLMASLVEEADKLEEDHDEYGLS